VLSDKGNLVSGRLMQGIKGPPGVSKQFLFVGREEILCFGLII
jgi:hypothetical protein